MRCTIGTKVEIIIMRRDGVNKNYRFIPYIGFSCWKSWCLRWFLLCCGALLPCLLCAQDVVSVWEADEVDEEYWAMYEEQHEILSDLAQHPLNLHTATPDQLRQLPFLSEPLIENLLYYVYKYAPLLTLHELMAVEGMDKRTFALLRPFVYLGAMPTETSPSLASLLRQARHQVIASVRFPLQQAYGYAQQDDKKGYLGDALYQSIRYRMRCGETLHVGFQAEKDAGEPFFSRTNRLGYDHYGIYAELRDRGRWERLVIGHYTASFGMGLTVNNFGWNSKWAALTHPPALGKGLRAHTSLREYGYMQGVGATYRFSPHWKGTLFASYKAEDADADSVWINRWIKTGLHRTLTEESKKNTVDNALIGGNLTYKTNYYTIGATAVYNVFNRWQRPVENSSYLRYSPTGRDYLNIGLHYAFRHRRWQLAGETAVDKGGHFATTTTLSYQQGVNNRFVLIHRYYDKAYGAFYAFPLSEATDGRNEHGLLLGVDSKPIRNVQVMAYADLFSFPYRRYRMNKDGTTGADVNISLRYTPTYSLQCAVKYHVKSKYRDVRLSSGEKQVTPHVRQRLAGEVVYVPHASWRWKTTVQWVQSRQTNGIAAQGYLASLSAGFTPARFPLKIQWQGTVFDAEAYDARLYLYEPAVLYAFGGGMYTGRGFRMIGQARLDIGKHFFLQARMGWTHYTDRDVVGTGWERTIGKDRAECTLLLSLRW